MARSDAAASWAFFACASNRSKKLSLRGMIARISLNMVSPGLRARTRPDGPAFWRADYPFYDPVGNLLHSIAHSARRRLAQVTARAMWNGTTGFSGGNRGIIQPTLAQQRARIIVSTSAVSVVP